MSRIRKRERRRWNAHVQSKKMKMNARATSWVTNDSQSGTLQVTNSHTSTENVHVHTTLTPQTNTKITKSNAVLLVSMYLETEL